MYKRWFLAHLTLILLFALVAPMNLADEAVDGREGRAEMRFLEGMSDHHQMALDMAADCLDKASTEPLLELCQNIIDAQSAEIELMRGWLLDWYNIDYSTVSMFDMNMPETENSGGHAGHGGNAGPVTDPPMMMGMFAGFSTLSGLDYDIAWLESMIDHHDDALHMAERLLLRVPEGIGHAELYALAQQIITDQTAEIALMEDLILELAG